MNSRTSFITDNRLCFTCIDLINSVAASLANCEAKESAEVNGCVSLLHQASR
jgi:hypothetical protein